jgi:hypothetical protein
LEDGELLLAEEEVFRKLRNKYGKWIYFKIYKGGSGRFR